MSRFDNPRNTAPSLEALQNTFMKVPRSTHDYSCTKDLNMWCGAIIPIDHIDTLPNEDYDLSYDIVLESISPLVKNLKTGFSLYVHGFYMSDNQLWEGAENFYTRGRSGTLVHLHKPVFVNVFPNPGKNTNSLLSLSDFLGHYCNVYFHSGDDQNSPTLKSLLTLYDEDETTTQRLIPNRDFASYNDESCLDLVMYQRIYTEFYMNQNLLINNTGVLPENQHHMILPYDCEYANVLDYSNPLMQDGSNYDFTPDGDYYVPSSENNNPLALGAIRYRQFKGDYFTTALPFADLVRGDIPTLSVEDLGGSAYLDFPNDQLLVMPGDTTLPLQGNIATTSSSDNTKPFAISSSQVPNENFRDRFVNYLNSAKVHLQQSLTLANLRALEAYTIFAERMARTSGKYNDMIKAQFNWNPGHDTLMPKYIGGFFQNIDIASVTQQSSDSNGLGLGSMSSKAISAGRNNIGHFHSPDFGHIMVLASIVPDFLYQNSGADRLLTSIDQNQTYFPILENLSPQMILNKELFVSGTQATDNNGFGWTELFSEYKSRQNRAYGLIGASSPDDNFLTDYGAYAMIRRFKSTPTLSNEFVTMSPKNIPNNIWQLPEDVPFIATINCNVRKTTCMSYVTQPGGLSSRIG